MSVVVQIAFGPISVWYVEIARRVSSKMAGDEIANSDA